MSSNGGGGKISSGGKTRRAERAGGDWSGCSITDIAAATGEVELSLIALLTASYIQDRKNQITGVWYTIRIFTLRNPETFKIWTF